MFIYRDEIIGIEEKQPCEMFHLMETSKGFYYSHNWDGERGYWYGPIADRYEARVTAWGGNSSDILPINERNYKVIVNRHITQEPTQ